MKQADRTKGGSVSGSRSGSDEIAARCDLCGREWVDCIHISEEQRCEIRALLARRDDLMQMLAARLARRNTDRCVRRPPRLAR
jgi:hypothetical protein